MRVTQDSADDSDPAFSPDSSQIAFHSEREGGGVYVVSALGGQPGCSRQALARPDGDANRAGRNKRAILRCGVLESAWIPDAK